MSVEIRLAQNEDLIDMLTIYNEVIGATTAVYTEAPVSLPDYRQRFETRQADGFPTYVATIQRQVVGFGSYSEFRPWPCYQYTVEHSLHVASDYRRRGVGRRLLSVLCESATAMSKHVIVGAIDANNVASVQLHKQFGFTCSTPLKEVGRKFGRWLDLVFVQKIL
jgi:phosphinothricin acetyltransferase